MGCRACGRGQLDIKVLSDAAVMDDRAAGTPEMRLVSLRSSPGASVRAGFRPFSACVCGTYESVVARGARLLRADAVTSGRTVHVVEKTLKRSELAKLGEDNLPPPPIDLFLVVHKISGARNPITDSHGLFGDLIARAWSRADVVLLVLFDMPRDYFATMLKEQPTLLGLLGSGRLLPLFLPSSAPGDANIGAEDDSAGNLDNGSAGVDTDAQHAIELAEATWWIARCLDGRVPRVEAFSELQQAPVADSADAKARVAAQRGATQAATQPGDDGSRRSQPSMRTAVTGCPGDSMAVLTPVVDAFEGRALVQD